MNSFTSRAFFPSTPQGDGPSLQSHDRPEQDPAAEIAALRAALAQTQEQLHEAQHLLLEQARVFQAMEELTHAGYWWRVHGDRAGGAHWSAGLCRLAGFAEQAWVSNAQGCSGVLPEDRPALEQALAQMDGKDVEYRWCRPDGQVRRLRTCMRLHQTQDGATMELGVVLDVTQGHQVAAQLSEQLNFIQRIASSIPGFIYQYRVRPDGSASIPYISDAVQDLLGVSPQVAMHDLAQLATQIDASDLQRMRLLLERSIQDLLPWQCEYRVHDDDGNVRWHMTSAVPQKESNGCVLLHGYTLDMTERKRAEEEIERLAFYDPLTGLPNRRLLLNRLEDAIAMCLRKRKRGALLFIDLDNFKDLNDTQGHDIGDRLLTQVAQRLVAVVRNADTVARFGGDEFIVILDGLSSELSTATMQAETVAEKLLCALNTPYALGATPHYSTSSIGITLFGDERHSVDELLKRADLAMYQAKAAGRNTQRLFDPSMQTALLARSSLETDLRLGLERGELFALYQPVVNHRGQVLGVEALARWRHPERGMISPADFIPLAEQTGLILPLGRHILRTACTQLVAWADDVETAHLSVAVNVSARQFRQHGFVAEVLEILAETGANPQRLKIELTESMLLSDLEYTIARMEQLQQQGVSFALDDFGTGYSSLSYLKRLPLDQVKIDQSFVRDVLTDPNDAAIVRTILALAQSLDLVAVAEGVETTGQMGFLRLHGCEQFQGYLFGRPDSPQALQALLHSQH